MDTYGEVLHCMTFYLSQIHSSCPGEYYRKRKAQVLAAAREALDAVGYDVMLTAVEEMEAQS